MSIRESGARTATDCAGTAALVAVADGPTSMHRVCRDDHDSVTTWKGSSLPDGISPRHHAPGQATTKAPGSARKAVLHDGAQKTIVRPW